MTDHHETDHTDLLRRLREQPIGTHIAEFKEMRDPLRLEAAAAIESLVAENNRIEEKLKRLGDEMNEDRRLVANALKAVNDVNESLTAERDALREQIELRKTAHNELADAHDALRAKNEALELSYDSNLAENDVLVELTATLRTENERLREIARGLESANADIAKSFVDERAEKDALNKWVADLQSGMYVNCVYCGHRYGPGESTPVSMADALKAHVEQCPKHPMSRLRAENEAMKTELERERIRLSACGVAADQNTERTRELHRLPADSEYRSGSYDAVCAAVDREIALRTECEALEAHPLPWHQGKMAHDGGTVGDAESGLIFQIHSDHAVAVAALIVALVNERANFDPKGPTR